MNERFTHIYAIWFVGNETGDWHAMVGIEDGVWVLRYRFRYYDGDQTKDAFECGDTKNAYIVKTSDSLIATRNKLLNGLYTLISPLMEVRYGSKIDEVLLDCANDDPKLITELEKRSWAHTKTMSKEEYDAIK